MSSNAGSNGANLLTSTCVLGLDERVKRQVFLLNDGNLLYFASNSLIVYNQDNKAQKIVPITEGVVNCAAVSPGENFLALAIERSERHNKPYLLIFDLHTLKRKRYFALPQVDVRAFELIEFTNDGKSLVILASEPEWVLFLFQWEKGSLTGQIKVTLPGNTPITGFAVNPFELSAVQVSTVANGYIRFYRFAEGAWKQVGQIRTEKTPSCQAWTEDQRLVVCTKDATILVFENCELASKVQHSENGGNCGDLEISAILPSRTGIFLGTSCGSITYYEKTDDMYFFKRGHEFSVSNLSKVNRSNSKSVPVLALVSSQTGDSGLVLLENKEMYSFLLGEIAYQSNSMTSGAVALKSKSPNEVSSSDQEGDGQQRSLLQQLPLEMHHGAIRGMSTCIRKPILASCASDNVIRVWNLFDWSCDIRVVLQDEPISIAVHPSGIYLAVATKESVKIYSAMVNSLRLFWESPIKCCRSLSFSHGGQYLAVVQVTHVTVLNVWSYEQVYKLVPTDKSGTASYLDAAWSQNDAYVVTWTVNGLVNLWRVDHEGTQCLWQFQFPPSEHLHAAFIPQTNRPVQLLISTSSGVILQVDEEGNILKEAVAKGSSFTHFIINKTATKLILGTAQGSVQVAKLPLPEPEASGDGTASFTVYSESGETMSDAVSKQLFGGGKRKSEPEGNFDPLSSKKRVAVVPLFGNFQTCPFELRLHAAPVTKLVTSFDETQLFSSSTDGFIVAYSVNFTEPSRESVYSGEILTAASELTQQTVVQNSLLLKIEALKHENSVKMELEVTSANEKLQESEAKHTAIVCDLKREIDELREKKQQETSTAKKSYEEAVAAHRAEIDELVDQFERKIALEKEKFEHLQLGVAKTEESHTLRTELSLKQQTESLSSLEEHFKRLLKTKDEQRAKLSETLTKKQQDHHQYLEALEEQSQLEMAQIMTEFETLLQLERDASLSTVEEKIGIKQTFDRLNTELEETKKELNKHHSELKRLTHMHQSLERDKIGVQQELWERDETIKDKELTISDLRKKAQELEKFKFVLDFKIKQLNKQLEPKQQDIRQLAVQIENMDNELADYHLSNSELDIEKAEQLHHLRVRHRELEKAKSETVEVKQVYSRMISAFSSVAQQFETEPQLAKPRLVTLYHRYCIAEQSVNPNEAKASEVDDENVQEQRRRFHLERSVKALVHKSEQEQVRQADVTSRLLREHGVLLCEMNDLQREARHGLVKRLEEANGVNTSLNEALPQSESKIVCVKGEEAVSS